MKRRLALILALSLVAGLSAAPAALANETNHVDYWESHYGMECSKIDSSPGQTWTSDDSYALVILKSAKTNDFFHYVSAGTDLETVSGKDISHIITCGAGDGGYVGV